MVQETAPGRDDAIAHRAGGLIARAGNYGRAERETGSRRRGRMYPAGDRARLVNIRQDRPLQSEAAHHAFRPLPVRHIEERRAAGIRNIGREIAAELEAQIVFGKQHGAHGAELLRFVVAHPQQLWQREAGENGIRGIAQHGAEAELRIDEIDLRLAALVAPDERGPNYLPLLVEQHKPVHLAGETDAAHRASIDAGLAQHALNRQLPGAPPVFGRLLGPHGPQHAHLLVRRDEGIAGMACRIDQ